MPATLNFAAASTSKKIFTPISTALSNLPNSGGTLLALIRSNSGSTGAGHDIIGMTNAATSAWYHAMSLAGAGNLSDDDGLAGGVSGQINAGGNFATTDWVMICCTWPTGGAAASRGHGKNLTTSAAWVHSASTTNGGNRAGPGTTGWMRLGYFLDTNTLGFDLAWGAAWGVEFSDTDLSNTTYTKTSDLWNHPKGRPIFLVEGTSSSPVDLTGNSTYSSANSTGTTLTGADPGSLWTFDQLDTQIVLPDADNVTTGWATAPLWSKVNDSSDATVITSTI